ncbi:hypothetical protein [Clostridium beijerinckii]|uniref:hypothetical protein n=1 Tax=Clostridium beijerinckii TaxID=1520 RepID=UPI0015703280|nr:hypothetical protein [Clostridium beijerinckii]NRU52414.1 hypothetical protein [Clostridium beijerinckii]NYC69141.1 hypothetical protein [Clostridium beijerinckii]NYC91905.1 hypothetical protein [Clostridium beijerinckii]
MKVDVNFYNENGERLELNNFSELNKENITAKTIKVVMIKENGRFLEEFRFNNFEGEIRFIPLQKK